MTEPTVLANVDARGVATITLNRPDKANAYDYATLDAIVRHFEQFGTDERVRAIVLRGAGRHFSAGADVTAGAEPPDARSRGIYDICTLIENTPRPTVALVKGACAGGGMALAACCDIVIADRSAFFSMPEVRLGFTPGTLSIVFVRAVGLRAFRRYAQSGQRLSADEALRIGFVHQLCEAESLDAALADQVEQILLAAPQAARNAKAIAARLTPAIPPGLAAQLQAEFAASHGSAEAQEGKASFREKRKPSWVPL